MSNGGSKSFRKYRDEISKATGYDPTNAKEKDRVNFAPDWYENLAQRIATGDLEEATACWLIFRGNGNHSLDAIHVYGSNGDARQIFLRQRDCALEIAWLQAGHPYEWLDAPLDLFRAEAARRGIEPIARTLVSEAVTFNKDRGIMARDTGYRLTLVPAPKVLRSPEHLGENEAKGSAYQRFLEWAKVARSQELSDLEVARSTVERLRKVLLSDYKKWRKSEAPRTNGARSYKPSETSIKESPPPPLPDDSVYVGPPPAAKAEEEEDGSFETLKARYPEKRFDEAKAKIAFHALSPADRRAANRGIQKYLDSERWQRSLAENEGQYIPQASKWLRERHWENEPPAYIKVGKNGESAFDQALAAMGGKS
jgi:hypothetical protein